MVGLIQDRFDRPAKDEGGRNIVELFGPSLERQSHDLIGSQHVRVAHQIVVEEVVHGCAVMEDRVDFTREEIPHVLRQAEHGLPQIAADGDHAVLEHLHQLCITGSHGLHRGPQSLPALLFVGRR